MAQNPLQQYFRQPKIYINLPSNGVYNRPGSIQGDATNMPVYGMTGMDEIIIRTPDALFSGEATAKIVGSCCPTIKDPWDLSILDTNLVFTSIRIATYGNTMTVVHNCRECDTQSEYDLDLNKIIEHYSKCHYESKVAFKEFTVKIKPLTYKQQTEYNLKMYEFRKQILQADALPEGEERSRLINELWKTLALTTNDYQMNNIDSVELASTVVNEQVHIFEWLNNCDKSIIDAIKKQIEINTDTWQLPTFPVECTNPECKHPVDLTVELDNANFFALA
jgi:hypothetical protein